MSYLAEIRAKYAQSATAKTDKTPEKGSFVSFVSTPQGTFPEKNTLDEALRAACQAHNLDPDALRRELVEAGDWPELTPEQVQAFVQAKARPECSPDELRAVIEQWSTVAGLDEARRLELLAKVENVIPARIREETQYFQRRIEQARHKAQLETGKVHCGDCVHFQRTEHPHLGHCARGEPEAPAGLWDTDSRTCKQHEPEITGG